MSGCPTCGGFADRHDQIAHDDGPNWITCRLCEGEGVVCEGDFDWTCPECQGDGGMEP